MNETRRLQTGNSRLLGWPPLIRQAGLVVLLFGGFVGGDVAWVRAADLVIGADSYAAGDFGTAAEEWLPLAEKGDPQAQFNMGLLYETGRGVPQDISLAVSWYRQAAEQGLFSAQYNLAVLYRYGRGVPFDLIESLFWFEIAMRSADATEKEQAAGAAATIVDEMSQADIAIVRARVPTWAPERVAHDATRKQRLVPYFMLSKKEVAGIQRRLRSLGYDPGSADGIVGPKTRLAIRQFQRDRGEVSPAGHVSLRLLQEVR